MASSSGDIELGTSLLSNQLALKIKTATGTGEIEILTTQNETVAELKNKISSKLSLGFDKHLRLIFSGKLLDPPNTILSEFKLKNGSFIHAVVSNKVPVASRSFRSSSETPSTASQPAVSVMPNILNFRGMDILLLANNRNGRPMLGISHILREAVSSVTGF